MRVVITWPARADLTTIALYIAAHDPRRARSFTDELRAACKLLATTSRQHALLSGFERLDIRRKRYGAYLILYRVNADRVDVVRIVHGARDLTALALSGD